MHKELFIDIETFSSVSIKDSGLFRYIESPDFEIILFAYGFDDEPVKCVDLLSGQSIPDEVEEALFDDSIIKYAHNAMFERIALKKIGYDIPIREWRCSMVKAAYCGLPLSLGAVTSALELDIEKLQTGKALIRYFCMPCKPTITNGKRSRNYPEHDPEKWANFIEYNIVDVESERAVVRELSGVEISDFDLSLYELDQEINDFGIRIDRDLVDSILDINEWFREKVIGIVKGLTGMENPNSEKQVKDWLFNVTGKEVKSLAKGKMSTLMDEFKKLGHKDAITVLESRRYLSKSSVSKYDTMIKCCNDDSRIRGLFQYYGASRTGRWAGRLVQLQNLPKNMISSFELDHVRDMAVRKDGESIELIYDNVSSMLSQLVRTVFTAEPGYTFAIADYNSIEARVLSWLAGEQWRMDVFNTHGKIYEATAARMFNVPIETVTKGSELRAKGKNGELALGYAGGAAAITRMDFNNQIADAEKPGMVKAWRKANPRIVKLWYDMNKYAIEAVKGRKIINTGYRGVVIGYDGERMFIRLPSGHELNYWHARLSTNRFGSECVEYQGLDQETKRWDWVDTYGGKLVENTVQAIARDLLGFGMLNLRDADYKIVLHVHDEVAAEVALEEAEDKLKEMEDLLAIRPTWAKDLPLVAEGFVSFYYKKD